METKTNTPRPLKPTILHLALALCISGALMAQPQGERPVDLHPQLARLRDLHGADLLVSIRALALHRHLFASANRSAARRAMLTVMRKGGDPAQAAAVAFYLCRSLKRPDFETEDRPSAKAVVIPDDDAPWRRLWAIGTRDKLDQGSREKLIAGLGSDDPAARAWAALALGRHRSRVPDGAIHLTAVLQTGTPDQRALAARILARWPHEASTKEASSRLRTILTARRDCPKGLRPYYALAIAHLPWSDPAHFAIAEPLLRDGLRDAELDTHRRVIGQESMPAPKVGNVLLEVLIGRDGAPRNVFRSYAVEDIRQRAAARLAKLPRDWDAKLTATLRPLLRIQHRVPAAIRLTTALGPRAQSLRAEVLARLNVPNYLARLHAAKALQALGPAQPAELRLLHQVLRRRDSHDSADLRRYIAQTLAQANHESATFFLELLAWNDQGDTCGTEALGQLSGSSDIVLDALLSEDKPLSDTARRGRVAALGKSNRQNNPKINRRLRQELDSAPTRIAAIQAIETLRIADSDLTSKLVQLLQIPKNGVDLHSAGCLATLGLEAEPVKSMLCGKLKKRKVSTFTTCRSVDVLLRYPNPSDSLILLIATKLKDRDVRSFVAERLGQLGAPAKVALPALRAALKQLSERETWTRTVILDALKKLGDR